MKANRQNPTLIRITSNGQTIGHITPDQFRAELQDHTGFLQGLVNNFNRVKELKGEPERAEQVIQLENGKTI